MYSAVQHLYIDLFIYLSIVGGHLGGQLTSGVSREPRQGGLKSRREGAHLNVATEFEKRESEARHLPSVGGMVAESMRQKHASDTLIVGCCLVMHIVFAYEAPYARATGSYRSRDDTDVDAGAYTSCKRWGRRTASKNRAMMHRSPYSMCAATCLRPTGMRGAPTDTADKSARLGLCACNPNSRLQWLQLERGELRA
eukprot:scaffold1782_cov414-Prasinococcus_capsulatus_cf.AAC.6